MFIQTEMTPNPAVIKFLPGREVMASGVADYETRESAVNSPLAQRLFAITGVAGVFLGADFVSVTKDDITDWSMLKPMVLAALMEHLSTEQPIILGDAISSNAILDDDDEIVVQIKQLIEERVRPAVAQDGGDIVFDRFDGGVVYLHLRGACSGCPSSTMTLKSGIENMLKHFVPEVLEVRAS